MVPYINSIYNYVKLLSPYFNIILPGEAGNWKKKLSPENSTKVDTWAREKLGHLAKEMNYEWITEEFWDSKPESILNLNIYNCVSFLNKFFP